MNRMEFLINKLNRASYEYYNGLHCHLTDFEYDKLFDELDRLEKETGVVMPGSPTVNVGSTIASINEYNYGEGEKPMLSLDKCHTPEELVEFGAEDKLIASVKCDGLSIRLVYENGRLVRANTRGNGMIGMNITQHAHHFKNIPLAIKTEEKVIVDGEAVILNDDFEIIKNNFKNQRNAAAGALNLLDMREVEARRLSFIAWDLITNPFEFYSIGLSFLEAAGFDVVPHEIVLKNSLEEFDKLNNLLYNYKGIPKDGIVYRINDVNIGELKGRTEHHFKNAIAWKPKIKEFETELIDIEWGMGKTGVLTPIAKFKPVNIDGSLVEKASLHNLTVMCSTLGFPYIGEKIKVYKANEIIPQISYADKKFEFGKDIVYLMEPGVCPICGKPTFIKEHNGVADLYCGNPSCSGKLLNIIKHYCSKSGMDIKGLSEKTIEKLIDCGWIENIADLYTLKEHRNEWINMPGFGVLSVDKILLHIDSSRKCTLSNFLTALSIPNIGKSAAKILENKFHTWDNFIAAIDYFDFSTLKDFGYETNKSIKSYDYSIAIEIANNHLEFMGQNEVDDKIEKGNKLVNLNFVITGKLNEGIWKNRNELKDYIISNGGRVSDSVNTNTSYLINNDINSQSSKNKKAKQFGIEIITEKQFIEKYFDK